MEKILAGLAAVGSFVALTLGAIALTKPTLSNSKTSCTQAIAAVKYGASQAGIIFDQIKCDYVSYNKAGDPVVLMTLHPYGDPSPAHRYKVTLGYQPFVVKNVASAN